MSAEHDQDSSGSSFMSRINVFRRLPIDSPVKTVVVVLVVSLICGLLVSLTNVWLQPVEQANIENEQRRLLLDLLERQPGMKGLVETVDAQHVETRIVNLATGLYDQSFTPDKYDQYKAERNPSQSIAIPAKQDIAGLKRRAKYAPVYLVRQQGKPQFVILPVHGKGYASTLYGYLGVDIAAETVIGLNFYQHGETPGLGARLKDEAWLEQWRGKQIRDADGQLQIGVARGLVSKDSPQAAYLVDGLSGATKTSVGITNMVRFWLGEFGFGPYLRNLKAL